MKCIYLQLDWILDFCGLGIPLSHCLLQSNINLLPAHQICLIICFLRPSDFLFCVFSVHWDLSEDIVPSPPRSVSTICDQRKTIFDRLDVKVKGARKVLTHAASLVTSRWSGILSLIFVLDTSSVFLVGHKSGQISDNISEEHTRNVVFFIHLKQQLSVSVLIFFSHHWWFTRHRSGWMGGWFHS